MTDLSKDSLAGFQKYAEKKKVLQELFSNTESIFSEIDQVTDAQILKKGQATLQSDMFKVLVIGEFKRGKSTFLNALMGEEILPAFAIPCTAVINEIKWSKDKYAILHFENPLPKKMPGKLAPDVQKHINAHKGKPVPAMKIPFDRLEEFVVIPDPGKDHAQSVFESPFKLVELFYPLEFCRNNIELIDSPGLNEHKSRTDVTVNYLAQADAIIFVLSSDVLCSMSEMDVINNTLLANGYEDIFFIINRFDAIREREKPRIKQFVEDKLIDKTSLGRKGLHFVSSLDALDAKLDKDPVTLSQSGFPELEKDLSYFLVENRGRIKILRPARDLRRLITKALQDTIPQQQEMLNNERQILEKRYQDAKPKLDEADKRRILVQNMINQERMHLQRKVHSEIRSFLNNTANEIPQMLEEYELTNKFQFLSLDSTKEQANEILKECTNFVSQQIEKRQVEWRERVLTPLVASSIANITNQTKANIDNFYNDLFEVKKILMGANFKELAPETSGIERVLAATGGFFLGGIGSGLVGSMMGTNEMLKSLIPNILTCAAFVFLGITSPFVLVPALLTVGGIQAWLGGDAMGNKIKSKIGQDIQKHLIKESGKSADAGAEQVDLKMKELLDNIDLGLQNEIESIRESVESIIKTTQSNKEAIENKKASLQKAASNLKKLQNELNDFMDEV